MIRRLAIIPLLLMTASAPLAAAPAPRLGTASFEDLPRPLPLPYDEAANAGKAVAAASARAKASGKLLLIDLGGNWCPDCRILAGTMELPQLKRFIRSHYEVVMVNVGRFDRNMDIPARYGIVRPAGVPALLVIDPKTGKLLNKGHETALSDARAMSPQALANWLASWTR